MDEEIAIAEGKSVLRASEAINGGQTLMCVCVCVCVCIQSRSTLYDPMDYSCQAPLSMEFPRQEY